ncbi:hypothetical protein PIB30_058956 [Stylosanthes scabra]|uniref:Uncharacterized protein n=1 Tax=Stylosanthes scabra TaxID=79078 RepID=A0ABU6QJR3_9FABA|nr:hypothetical protein [Stylosanthes scabra]
MNSKISGVRLNRTNRDNPVIRRGTTKTLDISPLTTVNNTLQQMLSQQTQPLPKPPTNIPNPLPSQPLLNPKGGLNALNDKLESEEEGATTNDEEAVQQLCEMLIEVTDTGEKDTGEIFDFYEEFDSDYKEEEVEERKLIKG